MILKQPRPAATERTAAGRDTALAEYTLLVRGYPGAGLMLHRRTAALGLPAAVPHFAPSRQTPPRGHKAQQTRAVTSHWASRSVQHRRVPPPHDEPLVSRVTVLVARCRHRRVDRRTPSPRKSSGDGGHRGDQAVGPRLDSVQALEDRPDLAVTFRAGQRDRVLVGWCDPAALLLTTHTDPTAAAVTLVRHISLLAATKAPPLTVGGAPLRRAHLSAARPPRGGGVSAGFGTGSSAETPIGCHDRHLVCD